jgi:alpha-mannosidase
VEDVLFQKKILNENGVLIALEWAIDWSSIHVLQGPQRNGRLFVNDVVLRAEAFPRQNSIRTKLWYLGIGLGGGGKVVEAR